MFLIALVKSVSATSVYLYDKDIRLLQIKIYWHIALCMQILREQNEKVQTLDFIRISDGIITDCRRD